MKKRILFFCSPEYTAGGRSGGYAIYRRNGE